MIMKYNIMIIVFDCGKKLGQFWIQVLQIFVRTLETYTETGTVP